ncbi:MAG TPA: NUDIX hydrolase [Bryobacteraceae bacterium]|jgi:ADP-ribose pyrophosphatase YjhB (NUDIX family)|nr:NUDIX hydrolase [Bryobacteraceae bacterium]
MDSKQLLIYAQRLQALAQAGLAYSSNAYDLERYQEIRLLSARFLEQLTDEPFEKIIRVFASEGGYQTPKVDIRAVVFRENTQILLVREKIDGGRWTLPGGWADVGYTPFEVAVKETQEETGLTVRADRLLALFDKREHSHPLQPWYVYKAFIRCELVEGTLARDTAETSDARWFDEQDLSSLILSTDRVTHDQLSTLMRFAREPDLPALCD